MEKNKDIEISNLVGLETYKALYFYYPNLYKDLVYDMTTSNYFRDLVGGVIASSSLNFEDAGVAIRSGLESLTPGTKSLDSRVSETFPGVKSLDSSESNEILVEPLIDSSYKIENLNNLSPWENFLWIALTVFLATFIIVYLYYVDFWSYIFNNIDGITCYDCPSVFESLLGI
jgi:hypothetical protein